jgi:membrane-bound lytic murein transglycosylase D
VRILAPASGDAARADDLPAVALASATQDSDAPFLPRPPHPIASATAVTAPATVPATPAPAGTPAATLHTVLRGESAWSIARRYGLRVEDLLARNGLLPRSVLRPGTVLKIALASE